MCVFPSSAREFSELRRLGSNVCLYVLSGVLSDVQVFACLCVFRGQQGEIWFLFYVTSKLSFVWKTVLILLLVLQECTHKNSSLCLLYILFKLFKFTFAAVMRVFCFRLMCVFNGFSLTSSPLLFSTPSLSLLFAIW